MPRSASKLRSITLALACVVVAALTIISQDIGICYAGRFCCWSITDGLLVLPIASPLNPTWGPWGFWIQEPWRGGGSFASQAGCRTVSIPLIFIYWAMLLRISWPTVCAAMRLPPTVRELLKWAGNLVWIGLAWSASYIDYNLAIAVSTVMLPSVLLVFADSRSQRRLRADKTPHCRLCNYNLTGNVSGICPECGTVISTQTAN